MIFMGFFMTTAVSLSIMISSPYELSLFDFITMPPVIGFFGGLLGLLVAVVSFLGERFGVWRVGGDD